MRLERFLLAACHKLIGLHADVARNLANQCGRDVTAAVIGHRRRPPIRMAKLIVRASLPHQRESQRGQEGFNLARLEGRNFAHG